MKITAIFASTEDGAFGVSGGNGLPWGTSAPEDLQHFKNKTMGHAMIMGYNTYPGVAHLQGRDKIVITSKEILAHPPSTYFASSMEEAIMQAVMLGHTEAFIIGGCKTLEQHAHLAHEVLWSRIPGRYAADTFIYLDKLLADRHIKETQELPDGTTVFTLV